MLMVFGHDRLSQPYHNLNTQEFPALRICTDISIHISKPKDNAPDERQCRLKSACHSRQHWLVVTFSKAPPALRCSCCCHNHQARGFGLTCRSGHGPLRRSCCCWTGGWPGHPCASGAVRHQQQVQACLTHQMHVASDGHLCFLCHSTTALRLRYVWP